jgi:hypothetical protein
MERSDLPILVVRSLSGRSRRQKASGEDCHECSTPEQPCLVEDLPRPRPTGILPKETSPPSTRSHQRKEICRLQATISLELAAREVSQRGGGARRGSVAPELMSPKSEIQAERAKRRFGLPGRIRTADLRLRRPLLYPTELRAAHQLSAKCPRGCLVP